MKNLKLIQIVWLLALLLSSSLSAQILEPVKWSTSVEKIDTDVYELSAVASIDEGWYLYSQSVPEGGPVPTTFTFQENEKYKLLRYMMEDEGTTAYDSIFEMQIKSFSGRASFKQQVRLLEPGLTQIKAEVTFMVCDDTRCLPPETIELNFEIEPQPYTNDQSLLNLLPVR